MGRIKVDGQPNWFVVWCVANVEAYAFRSRRKAEIFTDWKQAETGEPWRISERVGSVKANPWWEVMDDA